MYLCWFLDFKARFVWSKGLARARGRAREGVVLLQPLGVQGSFSHGVVTTSRCMGCTCVDFLAPRLGLYGQRA